VVGPVPIGRRTIVHVVSADPLFKGIQAYLSNQGQCVFNRMLEILVTQADPNQVFVVIFLLPGLYGGDVRDNLQRTSSICMSHGGGEDRSTPSIVSRVALVYLKSVSALSCLSKDCRRYRHPRSAGVPGHDETLSVRSQSDVSSWLNKHKL
jgi:hypothetical protein